jgi:seryl-tRNA synthetase
MKLVSKIEELKDNIETVENYLTEGNDEEKKYIVNLIRLGKCFVAYSVNDDNKKELRFVPSRFIGYIYNSISKHWRKGVRAGIMNLKKLDRYEKIGSDLNLRLDRIFQVSGYNRSR